ncbi:MAG: type II toxin-antitoxin system VapC family toxin [Aggregatilineales bacterium]
MDISFLFALNDSSDANHIRAKVFAQRNKRPRRVLDVTLTEVTYMLRVNIGQGAVLRFLDTLTTPDVSLQALTPHDIGRAREIMAIYASARLDFVDCCIMALSERLNITQICTFDRRGFSIFRPTHCEYLELVP